jgi:hypothetical protein
VRMRNRNCVPFTTLRTNSRSTGFPVARHALDCVLTWQSAVRVRCSSGSGPPSEARCAIWQSIEAHVAELERRHRALEMEIAEAHAHRSIDDLQIVSLKRRKLLVKDELARLKHQSINERNGRDRGMRVVSMIHGLHGHQIADHPRRRWLPSRPTVACMDGSTMPRLSTRSSPRGLRQHVEGWGGSASGIIARGTGF